MGIPIDENFEARDIDMLARSPEHVATLQRLSA